MVITIGEPMMVFNGAPDEPLGLGSRVRATFAGAESNVAIGLARLGHAVRYASVVGDDPFGHAVVRAMRGEGIDVSNLRLSKEHPTGVMFKNRWPGDEPQVLYYRSTSAFARAAHEPLGDDFWRDAKVLFLTGITPALSPSCLALFQRLLADARTRNIPVWLDPNYRRKLWTADAFRQTLAPLLPQIDTILPGLAEGEMLTGSSDPGEIACKLMRLGVKNVIVKAGAGGAMAYGKEGSVTRPPLAITRVIDPIGAGDGFAAGYLSAHLDGLPVDQRLCRAHAVAAMVCMTDGDWEGLPTRDQLAAFEKRTGEADR